MFSPASQPSWDSDRDRIESIIDLDHPNPARVGNALLGGGYNFAADRRAATQLLDADPLIATRLAVHQHLLRQATRVALDLGIKRFVQLGCGIPFPGGIHTLVGERSEAGRVVYVDPDPVVVELIEQATADDPTVTAVEADPDTLAGVLHDPRTRQVIGQGEPVLVMLTPRVPIAASRTQGPQPMSAAEEARPTSGGPYRAFDAGKTHPSRRYDYWLGGKDNFAADRASGDQIADAFPTVRQAAIENRRFLQRAVSYLVRSAGVTQFLDLGTGIPTSPNVHEIAQGIVPTARIVYVDHDPLVVAHGRALTSSTPEGVTAYLHGDLREPEMILNNPVLTQVLDLDRPIGLLLVAVLHFLTDAEAPYDVVHHLIEALPAGSFLAISHATLDPLPADTKSAPYMARGKPACRSHLVNEGDFTIVAKYGAEYRGIVQYYLLAGDVMRLHRLRWVMETSMLKTLARKHKSTVSRMAVRHKAKTDTPHGPRTCFEARLDRDSRSPLVARFGGIPLKRQKMAVLVDRQPIQPIYAHKELIQRLRKGRCELCQRSENIQVHHIRGLADLNPAGPAQPAWEKIMANKRRKTLVVCDDCHDLIHATPTTLAS